MEPIRRHWTHRVKVFFDTYGSTIVASILVFGVMGAIEYFMGRSPLGPDGKFGFWELDINGSGQSQRFADVYSLSHFIHGILFYGILWLVARKLPMRVRFVLALVMEAAWEILENSPIIIDRYRAVTIAFGYVGDSIFNSLSDLVFVAFGFLFASKARVWTCVAVIVALELFAAWWVRDNLTLNIIMLAFPLDSIKEWQMAL